MVSDLVLAKKFFRFPNKRRTLSSLGLNRLRPRRPVELVVELLLVSGVVSGVADVVVVVFTKLRPGLNRLRLLRPLKRPPLVLVVVSVGGVPELVTAENSTEVSSVAVVVLGVVCGVWSGTAEESVDLKCN